MKPEGDTFLQRYWPHAVVVAVVVIPVVAFQVFGPLPTPGTEGKSPTAVFPTALSAFILLTLLAVLALQLKLWRQRELLEEQRAIAARLEQMVESLRIDVEELRDLGRVTDRAKAILFRENECQLLARGVHEAIARGDLEPARQMIDALRDWAARSADAADLRDLADRLDSEMRQQELGGQIRRIESLLAEHQWIQASSLIESLIQTFPDSDAARSLRQRLVEEKQRHKRTLLQQWDQAIQRSDTDRGLQILKELDRYLSPNEALALQEAAKDVFRTKLHNLGVRFSLAVSDHNWPEALEVGQQIIQEFPNSRMSQEIRGKIDVLRRNVRGEVTS